MKDFFIFETELPVGSGFNLFGSCHLMWLFGLLIFTGISGGWYVRLKSEQQNLVNCIMGIVFPVIAIYRDAVLIVTGHFDKGFLPFHLCSMALWIAFVYIWTKKYFWGVVYILLCVPGAIGALLFPNWDAYPFFNYMHIHAFISHGLIVAFGIWLIWSGRVVPKWKDFWMPVVFGIVGFIILHWVNSMIGTNYWFLNKPSHGSPLVWILKITGERWYLAGYFLFCMVVVAAWQGFISSLHWYFVKHQADKQSRRVKPV